MTILAKLLDAKEPLFDHALVQLEKRTGNVGVDAKLAAEITEKSVATARLLGLGPDCTGPQLYDALVRKIQLDDDYLARSIGGVDPDSIEEMIPLIVKAVAKMDLPRKGFFLKTDVAEAMLLKSAPVEIMKRLGYDQVSKMLDRENLFEIFLALRFAESADWLGKFNEQYTSLKPSDFEVRDIQLVPFDPAKWGDVAVEFIKQKLHNITNSKEIGAIAVMPMTAKRMPGVTMKVLPLIIHYFNEITLYSAFFKLIRTKKNFGEIVSTTLNADPSHVKVEGKKIHWRVIQRYFGKHPAGHPEIFEPHLQPEDLHWRRAEEELYKMEPELAFWQDLDYVAALKGGDIVAFNMMDVSLSYSNQLSYSDRYIYHFRESLWNEVFARYFSQKTLEDQLLVKLNNDLIKPEELKS